MRKLFRDPQLQSRFDAQGYVVVPLLNANAVEALREQFHREFPETPPAFFSSSYLPDFARKQQISNAAAAVLAPQLATVLADFRPLGAAFLSKRPGPESELPMHQDWTIVDENEFVAMNVWTPLSPITAHNGQLQVIPGSHRTLRSLRAPTLPFIGTAHMDWMKSLLVPVKAQPGDAVFIDQALVHYSGPNASDQPRLALTTGVVSEGADITFHHWNKGTATLTTYAMDDDFLLRFDNFYRDIFQPPAFGTPVASRPYDPELPDRETLAARLGQQEQAPAGSRWQRWWKSIAG